MKHIRVGGEEEEAKRQRQQLLWQTNPKISSVFASNSALTIVLLRLRDEVVFEESTRGRVRGIIVKRLSTPCVSQKRLRLMKQFCINKLCLLKRRRCRRSENKSSIPAVISRVLRQALHVTPHQWISFIQSQSVYRTQTRTSLIINANWHAVCPTNEASAQKVNKIIERHRTAFRNWTKYSAQIRITLSKDSATLITSSWDFVEIILGLRW